MLHVNPKQNNQKSKVTIKFAACQPKAKQSKFQSHKHTSSRQTDRQTDRQADRQTDRHRQTSRSRQTDRQTTSCSLLQTQSAKSPKWQVSLGKMQRLLAEAAICFPFKHGLEDCKAALAKADSGLAWAADRLGELVELDGTELQHRQRVSLFMSQCLLALSVKNKTAEELLAVETTKKKIGELISWELSARPMTECEGWGQAKLTTLCRDAKTLVHKFQGAQVSGSMAGVLHTRQTCLDMTVRKAHAKDTIFVNKILMCETWGG